MVREQPEGEQQGIQLPRKLLCTMRATAARAGAQQTDSEGQRGPTEGESTNEGGGRTRLRYVGLPRMVSCNLRVLYLLLPCI